MRFSLFQAAEWMQGRGAIEASRDCIAGFSVDTRTLQPGELYFALGGPNHDGHDYVAQALEKGALAAVVDQEISGVDRILIVDDTLRALQDLAREARINWGGDMVGVTGSAGKTTTKDAVAHLLSVRFPVGKTIGNFNNHVGVPLSILRLPDECQIAVLEMGMNHAGEIRALAEIARPRMGVITNVGYAHVEFFDSIEGVALAKRELIESLPADGVAILNADDPRVARFGETHPGQTITYGVSEAADVRATSVEHRPEGMRFRCEGIEFHTPLSGAHGVSNTLAAIAASRAFGIEVSDLVEAVRTIPQGKMRGERFERNGITILNDAYNSNPEAVHSMLDVLAQTPARRRIAVLGEMLELGAMSDVLHRQTGAYAAARGIDILIGIRGAAHAMVEEAVSAGMLPAQTYFFTDSSEAGRALRRLAAPGDAVLFKGSRGVRVEAALDQLLEVSS